MKNPLKHLFWIVPLVIVIAIVAGGFSFRDGRNRLEKPINAQFVANQGSLSTLMLNWFESVGLQESAGEQYSQIMEDAFKGKYGDDGFGTESALFVAISEQFPDASGIFENWGNIQTQTAAGRKDYQGDQEKLLDMLQNHELYCTTSWWRPMYASVMGCPSDGLVARIGEFKLTGDEAMEKMWQIVLFEGATDAYTTGTVAPMIK